MFGLAVQRRENSPGKSLMSMDWYLLPSSFQEGGRDEQDHCHAFLQVHPVTAWSVCTEDWQLSHIQLAYNKWSSEWMGWSLQNWKPQVTKSVSLPVNLWLEQFTQLSLLSLRNRKLVRKKDDKAHRVTFNHFFEKAHDSVLLAHASEKAMAPHSSTLAWKIPWTEEPGGLQSMGSLRVGQDWATSLSLFTFMHWRRKWQPTPVFLPGEFQGKGSLVGHTESDTTEAT